MPEHEAVLTHTSDTNGLILLKELSHFILKLKKIHCHKNIVAFLFSYIVRYGRLSIRTGLHSVPPGPAMA